MTSPTYTELRRLLAEATPGERVGCEAAYILAGDVKTKSGLIVCRDVPIPVDATLIAAMRNALPGLLDAAERVARLAAAIEEWGDLYDAREATGADFMVNVREVYGTWPPKTRTGAGVL